MSTPVWQRVDIKTRNGATSVRQEGLTSGSEVQRWREAYTVPLRANDWRLAYDSPRLVVLCLATPGNAHLIIVQQEEHST